jgi:multicomponent Na+:H+ antiporter subunit D
VVFQLQLLFAAIFAFTLLKRYKFYPAERRAEVVDADILYRRVGKGVAVWADAVWTRLSATMSSLRAKTAKHIGRRLYHAFSPAGAFSQAAPSGLASVLTAGVLILVLIFAYVAGG